jgi:pyridoxamine 5'-phosphate oxidase
MGLAELRREYNLMGLRRSDLDPDPIVQFQHWFEQALGRRTGGVVRRRLIGWYKSLLQITGNEPMDINAVTLCTADADGRPSGRIVLLKGVDRRGFVFYTNYLSRKGRELALNPNASLVFYWPEQERQVCVSGRAQQLPTNESEAYFRSRPRGSRLAAWVSHQSEPVASRGVLEQRWADLERQYPGDAVPMPPYWGGYVLAPDRVEFWQGRPSRLHDRFQYLKQTDGSWQIDRLSP